MVLEDKDVFRIERLTKLNKDDWYRSITAKLGAKKVLFTTTHSLIDYARVAATGVLTEDFEELDLEDKVPTAGRVPTENKVRLNIEKHEKYEEAKLHCPRDHATGCPPGRSSYLR